MEIEKIIKDNSSSQRTLIVQKYIDKPLLVHGRKFDIRVFSMLSSVNGKLKGWFYKDCYFRTSSS
jgi:tubulin monoglycylase TTLL3/8